eukprot:gb/GECG01016323.1/.p1 GENE.gb/GECG01016323.1/~~gb/GECG01016323.1/.p1  ORF type:complete len:1000 (+),score=203.65 gb/GECG01016323.1/:1-3000(+)
MEDVKPSGGGEERHYHYRSLGSEENLWQDTMNTPVQQQQQQQRYRGLPEEYEGEEEARPSSAPGAQAHYKGYAPYYHSPEQYALHTQSRRWDHNTSPGSDSLREIYRPTEHQHQPPAAAVEDGIHTADLEAQLASIYSVSGISRSNGYSQRTGQATRPTAGTQRQNGAVENQLVVGAKPQRHDDDRNDDDEGWSEETARLYEEIKKKNALLVRARGTIEELQEELETSRTETQKARQEVANLMNRLREKEKESTELQEQLGVAQNEREQYKTELESLKNSTQRDDARTRELSEAVQQKDSQLQRLEDEKQQLERECRHLSRSLEETQTTSSEYESLVKTKDQEIERLHQQLQYVRQAYTHSERETKQMTEEEYKEMENLEQYAATLRTKLLNYEQALKAAPSREEMLEKDEQLKRLSKQLADISRDADVEGEQTEKEVEQLKNQIAQYSKINQDQQKQIMNLKHEISSRDERLRRTEQHWNDAEGADNEARIELQISQSRIRELESLVQTYQNNLDSAYHSMNQQKEKLEGEKRQAYEELSEVKENSDAEIERLKEQLELWKYQIRTKLFEFLPSPDGFPYHSKEEQQYFSDHGMLQLLKQMPRIKEWFVKAVRSQEQHMSSQWERWTHNMASMERSLDKLESKFYDVQRSFSQEQQQRKSAQQRAQSLLTEHATLSERLHHKDSEINSLRDSCDATADQLKELEGQNRDLQSRIDTIREEQRVAGEEHAEELEQWKKWGEHTESCLRRAEKERDELINTQQEFIERVNSLQNAAGLQYDLSSQEVGSEVMKALGALEDSVLQPVSEPAPSMPSHLRESLDGNIDRLGLIVRDIERLFQQCEKAATKLSRDTGGLGENRQIINQLAQNNQDLLERVRNMGHEFSRLYEDIREFFLHPPSPKRKGTSRSPQRLPSHQPGWQSHGTSQLQHAQDTRRDVVQEHEFFGTGHQQSVSPPKPQTSSQPFKHDTRRQLQEDLSSRFQDLGSRLNQTSRKMLTGAG